MLDLTPAARAVADLVDGVDAEALNGRTPCADYSVGDLLDHLMGLTVAFTAAATKVTSTSDGRAALAAESRPGEPSVDHLHPDWRDQLPQRLDALAAAWRSPAAWEGETEAGGVRLPAEVMGSVALNELVIHGWDLAHATGQPYELDEEPAAASLAFTAQSAEPGQEASREGIFGPVIDVPDDAPVLHRALGFSGRDPAWTP